MYADLTHTLHPEGRHPISILQVFSFKLWFFGAFTKPSTVCEARDFLVYRVKSLVGSWSWTEPVPLMLQKEPSGKRVLGLEFSACGAGDA